MNHRVLSLAFFLIFFFSIKCNFAQSCLENLFTANKLLNAGNTEGCLALVYPCSDKSNDESVRWQAYRLMSIAFLLKGNSDSARINAENMLDINPTYKANPLKDPTEFIALLKKIVVIPKFTLGLAFSAGTNTSFVQIQKGYVISDYNKTYTAKSGVQFGTNLGFYVSPNLAVDFGIYATTKKYAIDYSFTNWKVNVDEQMTYLDLTLTAKYIFRPLRVFRIFVQGGGYAGYMMYDQNNFQSTYLLQEQTFKLSNLNAIERRNLWNPGITGGLGVFYKLGDGHISLQANYYYSFTQINKAAKRYDYPEQIYTYYYVDDDIIVHNLALSLGYAYSLNYKVYRSKK